MATMDECFDGSNAHELGSDAAERVPEGTEVLAAAGGSPATFYPDTVAREWFEQWVKGHTPTAEFARNENGEYIVHGMHDNYLSFVAGWATRDYADRAKNKPAGDAVPNAEITGSPKASPG